MSMPSKSLGEPKPHWCRLPMAVTLPATANAVSVAFNAHPQVTDSRQRVALRTTARHTPSASVLVASRGALVGIGYLVGAWVMASCPAAIGVSPAGPHLLALCRAAGSRRGSLQSSHCRSPCPDKGADVRNSMVFRRGYCTGDNGSFMWRLHQLSVGRLSPRLGRGVRGAEWRVFQRFLSV